jgi:hypothetical protein
VTALIQQLRHEPLLAAGLIMLASLGSLNDITSTIDHQGRNQGRPHPTFESGSDET